jgi:phage tail sheath protein FI
MVYAPWVLIQDNYNDRQIGIPSSGYVAAAFAYNDSIGNVWDAPAGEARGMLNVLDVYPSNMVFNKGDRDAFADAQINPIQKFQGRGIMIYDQLTQQKKSSALSFINVRRELIAIERDCSLALRSFLLGANANNETTRFRIKNTLDSYFDDLSARGAFQTEGGDKGYQVNCDVLNNPGSVIDRGELHVDIFIKPVRVIRVIQLRAIITTTSISFEELMTKGIVF